MENANAKLFRVCGTTTVLTKPAATGTNRSELKLNCQTKQATVGTLHGHVLCQAHFLLAFHGLTMLVV
jgi:hypothetical protein